MRYVVLDTETTGLDPNHGHRIVEIGCVEVLGRQITGNNYHTYLNPQRDIDPDAERVHGLSRDFLSGHPLFAQQAEEFLNFVRGATVIIHNAAFDIRFLNAELERLQLGTFESYCPKVIDTLLDAREMFPGKRNSLDALCDRFGISNAHRTLHGALLDSELLADVWLAMTRGQNDLLMDSSSDTPTHDGSGVEITRVAVDLPVLHASPEDEAAHQKYLAGLDKSARGTSLWRQLWEPEQVQ